MDLFTSIELFAGAGGLALGLEQAGFKHLGLIEKDKNAVATLVKNRSEWNVISDNIENISSQNLEKYFGLKRGELDLLSGGAPCQSFSYAGKRLGLDDTRGTLFYHYALFLKKLQPKMFLFENVKGLKSHDKGKTYSVIKNTFVQCGYSLYESILDASYYGVPQKRERFIIIGIRNDLANKITFQFPEPSSAVKTLRDTLEGCPESWGMEYSETKKNLFKLIPEGGNWRNLPEHIAKEYMKGTWNSGGGKTGILYRLHMDKPSPTILTHPSQKTTERCHPVYNRPLTVRETARIQTFPDEWIFEGNMMSQYRQIGNAVPVKLAYNLGLEIVKTLSCTETH